jgi:hypothetical protein
MKIAVAIAPLDFLGMFIVGGRMIEIPWETRRVRNA